MYNSMYSELETLDFLKTHCIFDNEDKCYILMGNSRNKLNNKKHKEFKKIYVISKESQIEKYYKELVTGMQSSDTNFYVYVSLNSRSAIKAASNLGKKMIDYIIYNDFSALKNLKNKWYSELMKSDSRFSRGNFMIDYDSEYTEDVLESLKDMDVELINIRYTPNGAHIITKPFNPSYLEDIDNVSLKKDDLLFVNSFIKE